MSKEWYILEYEEKPYLHNIKLKYRSFPNIPNHHDHCDLCWNRFSQYIDDQHVGYYSEEEKVWICVECYNDFHKLFNWIL